MVTTMAKKKTKKVMYIEAHDHYSSDDIDHVVLATFLGEYIKEDDIYIYLRSVHVVSNGEDWENRYHGIVKSTIISQKEIIIEVE